MAEPQFPPLQIGTVIPLEGAVCLSVHWHSLEDLLNIAAGHHPKSFIQWVWEKS